MRAFSGCRGFRVLRFRVGVHVRDSVLLPQSVWLFGALSDKDTSARNPVIRRLATSRSTFVTEKEAVGIRTVKDSRSGIPRFSL